MVISAPDGTDFPPHSPGPERRLVRRGSDELADIWDAGPVACTRYGSHEKGRSLRGLAGRVFPAPSLFCLDHRSGEW